MYPTTVVILLGIILGTTLIQYVFLVPSAIANNDNNVSNSTSNNSLSNTNGFNGYWGPSNSDFDWCEYNYILTQYIAEPWNSLTSMIYVLISLISMYCTSVHLPSYIYTHDITFITFILILIGLGSTAFHATLLYKTQLFDEMPMHWLVSYASVMLFTRNDSNSVKNKEKKRNFYLYLFVTLFCSSTVIIIWTTPKDSMIHEITRLLWAVTFVSGFVYCFGVCCKMANEVYDKKPNDIHYNKINQFYDKAFISFTIALIGWICDNCYCQTLQNLKFFQFSVPYLHFHAFLWHIGTCIGLHYFFLVILAHRIVFQYKNDIKCTTVLGILPYVTVPVKSD